MQLSVGLPRVEALMTIPCGVDEVVVSVEKLAMEHACQRLLEAIEPHFAPANAGEVQEEVLKTAFCLSVLLFCPSTCHFLPFLTHTRRDGSGAKIDVCCELVTGVCRSAAMAGGGGESPGVGCFSAARSASCSSPVAVSAGGDCGGGTKGMPKSSPSKSHVGIVKERY